MRREFRLFGVCQLAVQQGGEFFPVFFVLHGFSAPFRSAFFDGARSKKFPLAAR